MQDSSVCPQNFTPTSTEKFSGKTGDTFIAFILTVTIIKCKECSPFWILYLQKDEAYAG